jgi:F-type H+-transporting ATPase subunit delta
VAAVLQAVDDHEELRRFLADPALRTEGKRRAIEELFEGRVHPVLLHVLMILVEQNALHKLPRIADVFYERLSDLRDKISGELVTVRPLSETQHGEIEAEVSRILGKRVHLLVREDPNLLGGLRVRVGEFILDGTVDRRLESMRQSLLS